MAPGAQLKVRTLTGFEYSMVIPENLSCSDVYALAYRQIVPENNEGFIVQLIAFAQLIPHDSFQPLEEWLREREHIVAEQEYPRKYIERDATGELKLNLFVLLRRP